MVLSKEEQDRIIEKVENVIKRKNKKHYKCPLCSNDSFTLAGGFTYDMLHDLPNGNLNLASPFLPSIPIVCTNCGNTFFLNANILGIKEKDYKDEFNKNDKKEEK